MSGEPTKSSPIERLLDLGVYAPLGFILTRDEAVAELAAAGREQVSFSRSLGRAALKGLARGMPPKSSEDQASVSKAVAVADYDAKTARDIIALVAQCSAEQVAWIRDRETQGKNRVTILRAIDRRAD